MLSLGMLAVCGAGGVFAQTPNTHPATVRPATVRPRTFDTPESAVKALLEAAAKNDTPELTAILGSAAKGILTSGDPGQDQAERQEFSQLAARKNRLERSTLNANVRILLVGDEDWPFPLPLVQTNGRWGFDGERGAIELRARRIGANELDAIEICSGYVAAQDAYAAGKLSGKGTREYARNIMSSPGRKDGLYWPGASTELVPEGFARAVPSVSNRGAKPYHGYFFRVLTEQGANAPGGAHNYLVGGAMLGGFGLVAWPAEYGVSGIQTFIVNHDGEVYEKDFGPPASSLNPPVTRYDPDRSWNAVD